MIPLLSALNSQNSDYVKNPDPCHQAPRKKNYIRGRGNNKPLMAKALSKTIMERTRLRNKFSKNPTNQNR